MAVLQVTPRDKGPSFALTDYRLEMILAYITNHDGPDSYLKFIKAIDRPAFGAHIDIANIINTPSRFYNNAALMNETFQKLGRWIVSVHGKDMYGRDGHPAETMPGKGSILYIT